MGLVPGLPTNAEYPGIYNNLGIPTATLYDMIFQTGDINNLLQGNFDTVFFDIVLRNGINTALEQAIGAQPTFMTVWIGSNDVLPAVMAATAIDGITMTPVDFFAGLYGNTVGALTTTTTADIVLINVPYPTAIPFTTSVAPYVDIPDLGRWYLMADTGQLTDDDFVTLGGGALIALGYGLPGGPPLPDNLNLFTGEPGVVLRAAEVDLINAQVDGYNAAIDQAASGFGYPVFDVNAFFADYHERRLRADLRRNDAIDRVPARWHLLLRRHSPAAHRICPDGRRADPVHQCEYGSEIPRVDMAEVLFEGDWQSPGSRRRRRSETVMSAEAFQRLYELFPPKLDQAPRIRRPSADRPELSGRDNRIRPATRP